MKWIALRCLLGILLVSGWSTAAVKVAVIGDSISTGAHAQDRVRNGYPGRIGHLLGEDHELRVFAVSGHALLQQSRAPLMARKEYRDALEFAPDVAVVMLGTNDTANRHWQAHADLEKDLRKMIAELREANPKVLVHLAGPPPMFPERKGLKKERVEDLRERKPRLVEVASVFSAVAKEEPGVVHHPLWRVLAADQTSDGVHPDTFGQEKIAQYLSEMLEMSFDESYDVSEKLKAVGVKVKAGDFHGFAKYDFLLPGTRVNCVVVAPEQAAEGHPWIWRARFFGHQPELDLSLLDRGWHVAYCDVTHLFGGPEAMKRWDSFYQLATEKLGFSGKPVLEGMSRGGLPIFYWAAKHPQQVAAVYGDNPVCDFRSWPGGEHGKRSDADWKRMLGAWGLTDPQAFKHPQVVDAIEPLALAKVPVAIVLGAADDVVPPAENGELVAARLAELGGKVKVWLKPGAGHHPHGLHPAAPLRRFLMAAAGFERNPASIPSPSSEYRGGSAGWGGGTWWDAFEILKKVVSENPEAKVVFLGDSITQGLTGHQSRVAKLKGKRAIDRYYGERQAISLGLSGDRTEHLLWRVKEGQFDGLSPDWVVLMIGVNNIVSGGHSGEETAAGTVALVKELRKALPKTKLLVLGSLAIGRKVTDPRRREGEALHQGIADLADGEWVFYQDLRPLFLNQDGSGNRGMRGDGIHATASGVESWMKAIQQQLAE